MTDRKRALITGVTGQDGAYLAQLLLDQGYEVHGLKRRSSSFNTGRIEDIYQDPHDADQRFVLHYGDLTDSTNLIRIVQETKPHEIYNLAAQSHVAVSFETAEYTANADAIGTLRLLEAIRILGLEKTTRFYQASTSELYGLVLRDGSPITIARQSLFYLTPVLVMQLFAIGYGIAGAPAPAGSGKTPGRRPEHLGDTPRERRRLRAAGVEIQ